ncbi:MAG TPA: adenylate/guanylate cyclase domain-containing protein [Bacteroidales bacterium]|nr:adenylate/guanylate cyclase domain-containing protein [Bacteroidales bacterium]HNS47699.1 adenylate/guanylate cyclase domain-containing protein [Bacteroidales bacterium]
MLTESTSFKRCILTVVSMLLLYLLLSTGINSPKGFGLSKKILSDTSLLSDQWSRSLDSLHHDEIVKGIQSPTVSFINDKNQVQIDRLIREKEIQAHRMHRQKAMTYGVCIIGVLLLLLIIGMFHRNNYIRRTKKIIENEKALSEKLLLNILPEETAKELKNYGYSIPKHYTMVSVLFADFQNFTRIAEKLTPQQLVEKLNLFFMTFDRIIDAHNLEKIKTIGDAYMCAGGIPESNTTNSVDIVKAGLEINQYMENIRMKSELPEEDRWELRIGIHTGPVVAGVVGKNKFAYDIWGDTVNIASCMESSGVAGKVNISGSTYELIKEEFICIYRGKIHAKNRGDIDMYIVEGLVADDRLHSAVHPRLHQLRIQS